MEISKINQAYIEKARSNQQSNGNTQEPETQVQNTQTENTITQNPQQNNTKTTYTPEIAGSALGTAGAGFGIYKVNSSFKPIKETLKNTESIALNYTEAVENILLNLTQDGLAKDELMDLFNNKTIQKTIISKLMEKYPKVAAELSNLLKENTPDFDFLDEMKILLKTYYPENADAIENIISNITTDAIKEEIKNPEIREELTQLLSVYKENMKIYSEMEKNDLLSEVKAAYPATDKTVEDISKLYQETKGTLNNPEVKEIIKEKAEDAAGNIKAIADKAAIEAGDLILDEAKQSATEAMETISEITGTQNIKTAINNINFKDLKGELEDPEKLKALQEILLKHFNNYKKTSKEEALTFIIRGKNTAPNLNQAVDEIITFLKSDNFKAEMLDQEKAKAFLKDCKNTFINFNSLGFDSIKEVLFDAKTVICENAVEAAKEIANEQTPKTTKMIKELIDKLNKTEASYKKLVDENIKNASITEKLKEMMKSIQDGKLVSSVVKDTFADISKTVNKYQKLAIGACVLLIPTGYAIGNIFGKIINSTKNKEKENKIQTNA